MDNNMDTPMSTSDTNVATIGSIIVQRQTMANNKVDVAETKAAVAQVAAVQQLTYDQLKTFWEQHQTYVKMLAKHLKLKLNNSL